MNRKNAQQVLYDWACRVFGAAIAARRTERAARLVEEAIEAAHAAGLVKQVVDQITTRVYSRPKGDLEQELAQVGICWLTMCENAGIDSYTAVKREYIRLNSIPDEDHRARHARKIDQGIIP